MKHDEAGVALEGGWMKQMKVPRMFWFNVLAPSAADDADSSKLL